MRDLPKAGWSRIGRTARRLGRIDQKLKRPRYPVLSHSDLHTAIESLLEAKEMTVEQPTRLPVAVLAGA